MGVDWTISVGSIIQLVAFVVGFVITFASLKKDVSAMLQENREIKEELKQITHVLITQADHNARLERLEKDYDMLRKGHGYVLDLPAHLVNRLDRQTG